MADQANAAGGKHVLVVDDNPELVQIYQELLQSQGYCVSTAGNGVQALKFISSAEVDAILCDLNMPELEGDMFYNAALHVRPELGQRFIFITGNAGSPKYEPFLKKTGAQILCKPVPVKDLLEALERLLDQ
jgi:CheY-like chemotaxis protein